ncbi:MAG: YhcH/YjgK/YiaL family protein [Sphaerochaeta sp.]
MIYDELKNLMNYSGSIPGYETIKRELDKIENEKFEIGKVETDLSNVYYAKQVYTTSDKLFEVHDLDIDIQMIVEGQEEVQTGECLEDFKYDEKGNAFNLKCKQLTSVKLVPGYFALFFPHEMHSPGLPIGEPSEVKKIVFKIRTA